MCFACVSFWGHPKAFHFTKLAAVVGKCVVLKYKRSSSKNFGENKLDKLDYSNVNMSKHSKFIISFICKTKSRSLKVLMLKYVYNNYGFKFVALKNLKF